MNTLWIAQAELRMLGRNKLVAASAFLVPLFFAAILIVMADVLRSVAGNAAILVVSVATVGVYITATTTLAARRQSLFLKRLRTTTASGWEIVSGLIAPVVVVNVAQIAIVLAVLATVKTPPARPWLLAVAVLLVELLTVGLALVTAARTKSPEHAQITTMPVFFVLFGVATWIAVFDSSLTLLRRAIPGGAATELMISAWDATIPSGDALLLGAVTAAWGLATMVVGLRAFKWERRT